MIKASFVKVLSAEEDSAHTVPLTLPTVDLHRIREREQASIDRHLSKIGVGVSPAAQMLFDALSKTMPCQWQQQAILVMEEILISPPYQLSDCAGPAGPTLERVKKVMHGELQRLQLAQT
eukprot:TRINITY_DN9477_c0_g2_i2.p1 TRINITY_DN9477_c0_g2~~TRINITY_DN9477_c0_g2_i2.p1  ORF type:complete len:120 (-),score=33.47 TRINITY_DN9477_c0_g2_i2:40-399(-)